MPIANRHTPRLIVLLLLALCLAQADCGRFLDGGQELNRDFGFLQSAPGHVAATACSVEPPQRAGHESLEQEHVLAMGPDRFATDFVRAAAFLSGDPASRLTPHSVRRSIPTRAPPFPIAAS